MKVEYKAIKELTEGKKFYSLNLEGNLPLIKECNFGKVQEINEHNAEFFYSEGGWFYVHNLIDLLHGEIIKEPDNNHRICLSKESLINLLKKYVDKYTKEIERYNEKGLR